VSASSAQQEHDRAAIDAQIRPLWQQRPLLEQALSTVEAPIVLCVHLSDVARFDDQDLTDAEFRECDLTRPV
jgi:hypothetical protein